MRGLLNLRKPIGPTSRALVNQVVRLVSRGIKVGHAGTLDPIASGVLVVAVGDATRLVERVQAFPKSYKALIRLGARSDTLDLDGAVVKVQAPRIPDRNEVAQALAEQVGSIRQVPPRYSALMVGGRRAHELARAGASVELAARMVRVDRIDLIRYEWPDLEVVVDCGAGTYIRSIARDVGDRLGCGGLIAALERTAIGPFRVEDAIAADELDLDRLRAALRPMLLAVADLPKVVIDTDQQALILAGRALAVDHLAGEIPPRGEVALIGADGELKAVAEHDPSLGSIRPRRVFAGG